MQLFRTNLINWSLSLLLMLGLAGNLVVPTPEKVQKTAFAQWLDRNLMEGTDGSEESIRNHLRQLPSQYEEFPLFLQQATLLVLAHKNDFRLAPLKEHEDSRDGGLWLFNTWAQQHDPGSNTDMLLGERMLPVLKWLVQSQPFHPAAVALSFRQPPQERTVIIPPLNLLNNPVPFLSGICINAP